MRFEQPFGQSTYQPILCTARYIISELTVLIIEFQSSPSAAVVMNEVPAGPDPARVLTLI